MFQLNLQVFFLFIFVCLHCCISWKIVSDADWENALLKADSLLEKVEKKYHRHCKNVLTGSNDIGFSQAWQDWILYRNFFAGKTDGLYLDIGEFIASVFPLLKCSVNTMSGSNHPITISNTVFFDKCLGWKGVCFEASSNYHPIIRQHRSCTLVENCVLDRAREVKFHGDGVALSIKGEESSVTHTLKCVGILDEIERLSLRGKTIDFLTIDIEGAEPDVFTCFPFDQIDVQVILIETNKEPEIRVVDTFFHAHGYVNMATLLNGGEYLDNVFVKLPKKLVYPQGKPTCTREDKIQNEWCGPFTPWANKASRDWDSRHCA